MTGEAFAAVRAAEPRDLDAIVRLADASNELHGDPRGVFDRAAAERDLFGPDACLGGAVALGPDRAAVVGHILWCFGYEVAYAARGAYVCDLYVDGSARGLGLGRALIAHAAASVRAAGGVYLWWATARWNEAARAFYTRLGASDEPIHAHALVTDAFDALADSAAAAPRPVVKDA